MEITTKAKLDEYISGVVKGTIMEQFAEFRKEQEAKSASMPQFTRSPEPEKVEKGVTLARIIRAYASSKGNIEKAADYAKANDFGPDVVKALATQPNSAGGYIVPPQYSTDLIELLYNRVAIRKLGAQSIPMPNGNLTIPKLTAGASASYIGENTGVDAQQPSFGVISLNWKKLAAVIAISNDLIRYSSPKADEVVKNDLTNAFAVVEDAQFLRGTGTGQGPRGLDSWIPTASPDHVDPAQSADGSDLTLVIADLFKGPKALEEANIPFVKPGWIISPRTKFFLMTVRDSVGNFYFLDEMKRGSLIGYPYVSTNQVPSNLGGGTDESVIYFGDFNDAVIGESTDLMLDVSQEASYLVNGSLVSAFAFDQTVIRGIARHDFCVRRQESFHKLDTVKWGK
jgi:HK97 family phage major capsid protein